MKNYFRVMLGRKSIHAPECFSKGFMGVDFDLEQDLTGKLPEDWRAFNKEFIPVYLHSRPEKSKIAAGLACGVIWTVCKGIQSGDVVLSPDGTGSYRLGVVSGDYRFVPGEILPHRRAVNWLQQFIRRSDMNTSLRNSTGAIGTVADVSKHFEEIERLSGGLPMPTLVSTDATVDDPAAFAMESHLEEFLVKNWAQTELGKDFDIFEEEGDIVGQQYPTDTGPIDILAIRKDKKELLVVELKKGRASDAVVGQILRYMGYVQQELAETGQSVRGIIIALDDDQRIRRALSMAPSVAFYRYQVSFRLLKVT